MWQLKFIQEHKDCIYSKIIKELKLSMYGYPINNFYKDNYLYVTNIQILNGEEKNIKTYLKYLRSIKNLVHFKAISPNIFLFQIRIYQNYQYYKNIYNKEIIYPEPIIHENGREVITILSWDRKLLSQFLKNIESNKNTSYFKLLKFKKLNIQEFFIPQIIPKLTKNQREILGYAKKEGYWNYPKKINLTELSKKLGKSKSTIHETLKRAERKLLDYYI